MQFLKNTPTRRSKKRGTRLSCEERLIVLQETNRGLQYALLRAKLADAPQLAGRIRAAIKSCGGAIRHAKGRQFGDYAEERRAEEDASEGRDKVIVHMKEVQQ